jgi:hypothetical protein
LAFLLVPIAIYALTWISCVGITVIWNDFESAGFSFFINTLLMIYFAHEILHVIRGVLAGAKINSFEFNFNNDSLAYECNCRDEVSLRGLKLFILLPFLVLTPLLTVIGYNSDTHLWWFMLALSISGCAYDLVLFIGLVGIPDNIRVYPDLEGENGYVYVRTAS